MRNLLLALILITQAPQTLAQKTVTVFLDPKDSSSNRYLIVHPDKPVLAKGYLILVPGFSETAEDVLVQSKLPAAMAAQGIFTFIPTFKTGLQSFGVDSATQASFRGILSDINRKQHFQNSPLYLGGFSIGGSCVIKFAELAVRDQYRYQPAAVFAIDPPLDWERYYNAAQRYVRLVHPQRANQEPVYLLKRIEQEMGGTPTEVLQKYRATSPYTVSDTTQEAVKLLVKTKLLIVAEPDLQWWRLNRGYDVTSLNIMDASAMINELQMLGNDKASLLLTEDKGFREPNHMKHPHSWSIAEPGMIAAWLFTNP